MFYLFCQNNSWGSFTEDASRGISKYVIIEAQSAERANEIAQLIGIYFDGVDKGIDCPCCGDRWYRADSYDGYSEPTVYGKRPVESKVGKICIHYLNGGIEYVGQ